MTAESDLPEPGSAAWAPPTPTDAGPPLYRVSFTRVTSMLILTQQRRVVLTGTHEQLEASYRSVRTHNLLLGWWGIPFGLVWTPLALHRNRKNIATIRQLVADKANVAAAPVS